jgi:hypothetical protein
MTRQYRDAYSSFIALFVVVQLIVCSIILFFSKHYIPNSNVGWVANAYFSLFSIIIYLSALKNLSLSAGNAFIRIVMGGSGIKIGGAILVLLLVHLLLQPLENPEIILFLIIYVLFAIFETYTLTKLNNH